MANGGHDAGKGHPLNLAAHDLNLLTAFDALMHERNVTRAAERIGLSQSAMSHTLRRLRELFDDRLFVRTGNTMLPTKKATELASLLDPALASIKSALRGPVSFDPKQDQRHFSIGMNDATVADLLPDIVRNLRTFAPRATLSAVSVAEQDGVGALLAGRIELAFDVYGELPDNICRQTLLPLELVGIAGHDHPALQDRQMTLEAFFDANHVRVLLNNEHHNGDYDRYLSLRGLKRRIVCETPFFSSVPELVRDSDLVAVIGSQSVPTLRSPEDFTIFELPLAMPQLSFEMIWHPRSNNDAGHRWLRDQVLQLTGNGRRVTPAPSSNATQA